MPKETYRMVMSPSDNAWVEVEVKAKSESQAVSLAGKGKGKIIDEQIFVDGGSDIHHLEKVVKK